MNQHEKEEKCREFFNRIADILSSEYEVIGSCNQDISAYLVKFGTDDEISYHGKPELSFRISDHWNWYSNLKKCAWKKYIKCYSPDLPFAKPRVSKGKASKPIIATAVAFFEDGIYKVIYGECYDREKNEWYWIEQDPYDALIKLGFAK